MECGRIREHPDSLWEGQEHVTGAVDVWGRALSTQVVPLQALDEIAGLPASTFLFFFIHSGFSSLFLQQYFSW